MAKGALGGTKGTKPKKQGTKRYFSDATPGYSRTRSQLGITIRTNENLCPDEPSASGQRQPITFVPRSAPNTRCPSAPQMCPIWLVESAPIWLVVPQKWSVIVRAIKFWSVIVKCPMINRRIRVIYDPENYHIWKKIIPTWFFFHLKSWYLTLFFRTTKNNIKTDTKWYFQIWTRPKL